MKKFGVFKNIIDLEISGYSSVRNRKESFSGKSVQKCS